MLDWIKNINKPYPEFWKDYISEFDEKSNKYIAVSIETTGIDPRKDTVISFGAVAIVNDTILIGDSLEIAIHDIENNSQATLLQQFITYIGNGTLVGHRIHFDIDIINAALDKIDCGRLKNEALDIEIMYKKLHDINDKNFSLSELMAHYKVQKSERISSGDDAFSIAILFLKLKSRLGLK